MAVGFPTKANWAAGDVLTASQMDDLAGTLNTVYAPLYNAAGKNKIINGDFGVWQRGTSFSNPASLAYTSDRWAIYYDGTGATRTISQQSFTAGTAPVSGYEGQYFYRYAVSAAGAGNTVNIVRQYIENVRTFAGQTVTVSFWAKAASNLTMPTLSLTQNFGTGGSPSAGVDTNFTTNIAITTSWQRFTYTVAVPSISGKTIGTNNDSALELRFLLPSNTTFTFDIWGVQLEAGSYATGFQTATGTVQGELAACQRYFINFTGTGSTPAMGAASTTSVNRVPYILPVTMRTTPSASYTGTPQLYDGVTLTNINGIGSVNASGNMVGIDTSVASGLTQYRPYQLYFNNGTVNLSAEL